MNELDKKLAKWAFGEIRLLWGHIDYETGAFYSHNDDGSRYEPEYAHLDTEQRWCFDTPDRDNLRWWREIPNFTDLEWGIAHCFKWLAPNILDLHYITFFTVREGAVSPLPVVWWDCNLSTYSLFLSGRAGTPALALCLAIEKLIDRGE